MVGGMRGKAMELVEGKITGLPFPANAEIVLEGYVHHDKKGMRAHLENGQGTMQEE